MVHFLGFMRRSGPSNFLSMKTSVMHIMLHCSFLGPHGWKGTVGLRKLYNWHCRHQNGKQNMLQNNLQLTITMPSITVH